MNMSLSQTTTQACEYNATGRKQTKTTGLWSHRSGVDGDIRTIAPRAAGIELVKEKNASRRSRCVQSDRLESVTAEGRCAVQDRVLRVQQPQYAIWPIKGRALDNNRRDKHWLVVVQLITIDQASAVECFRATALLRSSQLN